MKKIGLIACLAIFLTLKAGNGCPEFNNSINVLNPDGASSKELSMENAEAKAKKQGLYRGVDNSIRLEGPNSSVSIAGGSTFIFKPINPAVHPSQQIKLYMFETESKFRKLVVGGTNMFGGSKNKKANDDSIDLTFEKVSDGCYKVKPSVTLPKGEYAFSLGTNPDVQGASTYSNSVSGQVWFGFAVK